MTGVTRHTHLEPVSPDNAVLLFVDQQEGWFSRIYEPEQTRSNVLALARSARLLGIPAALTTALAAGPNGPQLPELTEIFSGQAIIDRTLINADACHGRVTLATPAPTPPAGRLGRAGPYPHPARRLFARAGAQLGWPQRRRREGRRRGAGGQAGVCGRVTEQAVVLATGVSGPAAAPASRRSRRAVSVHEPVRTGSTAPPPASRPGRPRPMARPGGTPAALAGIGGE